MNATQAATSRIPKSGKALVREHNSSARWLQMILDVALVVGLFFFHAWYRGMQWDDTPHRLLAFSIVLLMLVVYSLNGVYRINSSFFDRFTALIKSWSVVVALTIAVTFLTKSSATFSREATVLWSISGFVAQLLSYLFVRQLLIKSSAEKIPCVIVGTQELAQHLEWVINANRWIPDEVVGLIESDETNGNGSAIASIDRLEETIKQYDIRRVYLALPMKQADLIQPLFVRLAELNIDVIWAPDIFSVDLLNHSVRELGGAPVISLSETPLVGSNKFIKAVMDFSIALVALIVLSPVMLVTALIIKVTSPGPVIFTQLRHGWDGEVIKIYKFRSMVVHEEPNGVATQATRDDPRVTPIGRFIRKSSIDELPQLFNVLNGTMSIVGPRPHPISLNDYYSDKIGSYMARHRVKPGLTGLAQVSGFRGETRDIKDMEGRIQHDLAYINNWSPWLDIQIMLRTLFVLVRSQNAY